MKIPLSWNNMQYMRCFCWFFYISFSPLSSLVSPFRRNKKFFALFNILKMNFRFFCSRQIFTNKTNFLSSENLSWIKYAYGILFYFFLNFYVCDKCGFVQKSCAHVEVKSFSNMQIWFCLFYRFFLVFCRSYFGDWSVCWPWSAVNWSADSHNFSAIFTMLEPFYSNESQF